MNIEPINHINGMKVFVTPDLPKMKLASGDYVTPEFRAEIDAWLLTFFGTTNTVPDDEARVSQAFGQIWLNPRTYDRLRAAL